MNPAAPVPTSSSRQEQELHKARKVKAPLRGLHTSPKAMGNDAGGLPIASFLP